MNARTEYIDRLRKLADLLEATPDLQLPFSVGEDEIQFFPYGAAETANTARLFPSGWSKNDPNESSLDASYYILTGKWEGAIVTVLESRSSVCERVQTGTESVIVPAVEAVPETVVERPVYEFKCEPLLAKAVG